MRCEIDDARMFLHVMHARHDPLEVLREALSNSYDARARYAKVTVSTRSRQSLDVEVVDNGHGVRPMEFRYFFGLGFGNKSSQETIGNKGLGTKLFFNSDAVEVVTKLPTGGAYSAALESPLGHLERGVIPDYSLRRLLPSDSPFHMERWSESVAYVRMHSRRFSQPRTSLITFDGTLWRVRVASCWQGPADGHSRFDWFAKPRVGRSTSSAGTSSLASGAPASPSSIPLLLRLIPSR